MAIVATELAKLVSTAVNSVKAAEDGDNAEAARAIDALKQLSKCNVTVDLLKQTEAGKKVNKMAKSTVAEIAKAADAVVQAWKESVKKQHGQTADKAKSQTIAHSSSTPKLEAHQKQPSMPRASSAPSPSAAASKVAKSGIDLSQVKGFPPKYPEPIRTNACKMFAEGLAISLTETHTEAEDPAMAVTETAMEIETAAFQHYGCVNNEYKAKVKQLMFNLRDPNNPDLRREVLFGGIQPSDLVTMEPEQLASNARKEENQKIRQHMAAEAVRGQTQQASTDQFQCPRCKQRKCTYYQMQTRSADEPMTTFVTCTNCLKKWKFC